MSDMTLDDAIMFVEAFGLRVVAKDRIKKLSYHVAITDFPDRILSLTEEEILSIYERKVEKSIIKQLIDSEAIKHSIREEPMVKFHDWNLNVIV